jgi:hypothetical protein
LIGCERPARYAIVVAELDPNRKSLGSRMDKYHETLFASPFRWRQGSHHVTDVHGSSMVVTSWRGRYRAISGEPRDRFGTGVGHRGRIVAFGDKTSDYVLDPEVIASTRRAGQFAEVRPQEVEIVVAELRHVVVLIDIGRGGQRARSSHCMAA